MLKKERVLSDIILGAFGREGLMGIALSREDGLYGLWLSGHDNGAIQGLKVKGVTKIPTPLIHPVKRVLQDPHAG